GGHFQHGVAHVEQRPDHAAGDGGQGAGRQTHRRGEQQELDDQRAQRGGTQVDGAFLGGVQGGFGNANSGGETADRDRAPLVRGQFGLAAVGKRRQQAFTKLQILRFEIGGLV